MGMDATATIWIGVGSENGLELSEKMETELEENGEINKYGFCFQNIYQSDNIIGFGYIINHYDWDYGAQEFDPITVQQSILMAKPVIEKFFKKHHMPGKVKVYIHCDFS